MIRNVEIGSVAGVVVALAASVAGTLLVCRGLWDAQPLVTFGVLPTEGDATRGRRTLWLAALLTVAAGALVAAGGAPLRGLVVSLGGPIGYVLSRYTPPRRGMGWAGLLLALAGVGLVVHRGVELA